MSENLPTKRISLAKVLKMLRNRLDICSDAADRYADQDNIHAAASERCAASELRHAISVLTNYQDD